MPVCIMISGPHFGHLTFLSFVISAHPRERSANITSAKQMLIHFLITNHPLLSLLKNTNACSNIIPIQPFQSPPVNIQSHLLSKNQLCVWIFLIDRRDIAVIRYLSYVHWYKTSIRLTEKRRWPLRIFSMIISLKATSKSVSSLLLVAFFFLALALAFHHHEGTWSRVNCPLCNHLAHYSGMAPQEEDEIWVDQCDRFISYDCDLIPCFLHVTHHCLGRAPPLSL